MLGGMRVVDLLVAPTATEVNNLEAQRVDFEDDQELFVGFGKIRRPFDGRLLRLDLSGKTLERADLPPVREAHRRQKGVEPISLDDATGNFSELVGSHAA